MRGANVIRWVGALGVATSLAACGSSGSSDPTDINPTDINCPAILRAPNGVKVEVRGLAAGTKIGIEVCSQQKCVTESTDYEPTFVPLVAVPSITSTTPVAITVTVRSANGKLLVQQTNLTVTPVKEPPGKTSCPVGYYATAVVSLASVNSPGE